MRHLWSGVRLFFEGARLSYIALFRWLQPTVYLASKVLMPISQVLFFTFLGTSASGAQDASFYIIGNVIQMTSVSGIYGVTLSIGGDREEGTLPMLISSPANRLVMYLGRAFFHVLDGMVGVIFGFLLSVLFLKLSLSQANFPALALTILITTLSTSGMGLMLGSFSLITVNVFLINNIVYFLLLIFSGANLALETLPSWVQTVSRLVPLSRGIVAARRAIAGSSLTDVLPLLTGELLVGLVYVVLGYGVLRWLELQARQRGTLETI